MSAPPPDPALVEAWLTARSIARGHPLPVREAGGLRVDTGAPEEQRRYVFAAATDGLRHLGATIEQPFIALKLCGSGDALMALLPPPWSLASNNVMMICDDPKPAGVALLSGYRLTVSEDGPVIVARIVDGAGGLAASGSSVEHDGAFIFDSIRTHEAHQRRGLGTAIMNALLSRRRSPASRAILTATPAGRALYRTLGWQDYSPYATALIPA